MLRAAMAVALVWASACGAQDEPKSSRPPEPAPAKSEPARNEPRPPDPAPQLDAAPAPEPEAAPEPAPKRKGKCKADAEHCCLADGKLVRPGGCQPMYPPGVRAATKRGAGGWCEPVECNVRCLPATARIATPAGTVAVSELRAGDLVWTVDGTGARVAAPIARMGTTAIEGHHELIELTLSDGRVVRASAAHPTIGGGAVGALAVGDALDGSAVVMRRSVPYAADQTWDLLPDSATGAYWADGVLLGSTLE